VDASYEGDLLKQVGVSYTAGEVNGSADRKIQAYCYRMLLTWIGFNYA